MDGTGFNRPEGPLTRRMHERAISRQLPTSLESPPGQSLDAYHRILTELEAGEWRIDAWAEELGISVDEMLIELDRHLHHQRAA